mmetsp:Transcript_13020/g.17566  ORF Transcript_13020/g.17566 Transcript_13020/m.17566 type:complete len:92 (+) Transcript_13020:242-517(+)
METVSNTNSDKTFKEAGPSGEDKASHTSRSVGEGKTQRRRRGDRSKGETATAARVKKILPKNLGATGEGDKPMNIQPLLMAPVVNYEAKMQ